MWAFMSTFISAPLLHEGNRPRLLCLTSWVGLGARHRAHRPGLGSASRPQVCLAFTAHPVLSVRCVHVMLLLPKLIAFPFCHLT